jgi:hypothetical protein
MKYITTENVVGHPECPDENGECPDIFVSKGEIMELTYFDEYSMQFKLNDGREPCFLRETICDDCSSKLYYNNYFSLPHGIIRNEDI